MTTGRPSGAQLARAGAGGRVVGVDVAVAEVADEQVAAEPAEAARRQRQAPRRVERAPGDQPPDERAVIGEHVHEPVAPPGDVVVQRGVLLGERHVQPPLISAMPNGP